MSPDEFRAKQKAYITEKAGLTKEEAAKFFPVYFEVQDRKKQLNDEAWNLSLIHISKVFVMAFLAAISPKYIF